MGIDDETTMSMRARGTPSQAIGQNIEERNEARDIAIDAMRQLERKTRMELTGDRLFGMTNLGTNRSPLYGARVRGIHPNRPLQLGEGPILVLYSTGELIMAEVTSTPGGRVFSDFRPASVCDLRIEDMEAHARVLAMCLTRHLEQLDQRAAAFDRVKTFAARLAEVVAS